VDELFLEIPFLDKLKIFLAEDHLIVREGLKLLINSQPDMVVVGEASNGEEACRDSIGCEPDVILMDISMPRMNGIQATRLIIKNNPNIKILALSVHEESEYLRVLLEAGASGYVLKRSATEELISAIYSVSKGGVYLDPSIAGKLVDHNAAANSDLEEIPDDILSPREGEVARLIAQGYSNKEVAAQLEISVKTVETYKSRVMAKLGLQNRPDFIRLALKRGWLTEEF
jgi:two-component system, NarL family, response regulator NreC